MPILRNTCDLRQNGLGEVNRSRPAYFDLDIYLHYVYGLYRPTKIDQHLDRER